MILPIKLVREGAKAPEYATEGSLGIDLFADHSVNIFPGTHEMAWTGVAVDIGAYAEEIGHPLVGQLHIRSSLAKNRNIRLGNCTGIIDEDYHREIGCILFNDGDTNQFIQKGEKIAQLLIMPVFKPNLMVVEEFDEPSERGGFGSTGK